MKKGKIARPVSDRFFEKIKKTKYCWEWIGSTDSKGYGRIGVGSKSDKSCRSAIASRVSWEIHFGEIPRGLLICHTCDNRMCVNPKHLFIGDHPANMRDMALKKRSMYGTKNIKAKFTDLEIIAVRAICKTEKFSFSKIAIFFGVHIETIGRIHRGESWKHL